MSWSACVAGKDWGRDKSATNVSCTENSKALSSMMVSQKRWRTKGGRPASLPFLKYRQGKERKGDGDSVNGTPEAPRPQLTDRGQDEGVLVRGAPGIPPATAAPPSRSAGARWCNRGPPSRRRLAGPAPALRGAGRRPRPRPGRSAGARSRFTGGGSQGRLLSPRRTAGTAWLSDARPS